MIARSSSAVTTVLSATTDPTERSMPPDTITMVMPSAATQTMTVWRAISSRLAARKNCGPMSAPNSASDEREPDEDAGLVEQAAPCGYDARAPDAAINSACSFHSATGLAGPSRPRDITAMRSHTPSNSGR